MTEFLSTTGISHQIEEIIKNAEERLWLISPFLKITPRIKQLLEDTNRLRIDSRVIYGKNELQPEENNWLESMTSIRTSFCKDLHAKCYMNESVALLTSMNLYEYSQVNNYEMGLLVSRKDDPDLYEEIYQESRRILRASEEIRVSVARIPPTENDKTDSVAKENRRQARPAQATPRAGYCIRCKSDIPANPTQPYCSRCYATWKRYSNSEYEEKQCHTCGSEHTATLLKPLCMACYRKYKDVFVFSTS
jgi:hypothetical protein